MSRSIQDALFVVTRALPTADGTVTSADIDLKADAYKSENVELHITVPALTATHLPDADTLTITVQGGASATPTTALFVLPTITGSTGYAGKTFKFRLPPDCPRYLNVKFVAAGGTGDISGVDATVKLTF